MTVRDLTILGCSSQQPTRTRNHNAYFVRWNECGFLFDPGEGTQRQFMHASVSPGSTTHIFISHFHGDHCLGLPSMLMRFNLDKVTHPIHIIFPASGKRFLDRLRHCAMYHDTLDIHLHPVQDDGLIMEDDLFEYFAYELDHGIQTFGYRIVEKPKRRFNPQELQKRGIVGPKVRTLLDEGKITLDEKTTTLEEVSYFQPGDILAVVLDTKLCDNIRPAVQDASLLLCESTYMEEDKELAKSYHHLTACQAATVAAESNVQKLILTHFSARYSDLTALEAEARAIFPNTDVAEDGKQFSFGRSSRT